MSDGMSLCTHPDEVATTVPLKAELRDDLTFSTGRVGYTLPSSRMLKIQEPGGAAGMKPASSGVSDIP